MTGAFGKILLSSMAILVIVSSITISAEENPPQIIPGGGYDTLGDWVIESGDEVNWSASTILVSGNLTVESGGSLVLENVELLMNTTHDGFNWIHVERGAEFRMTSGRITSIDGRFHYNMTLRGDVHLEEVEISEVWGDPEIYWEHGIIIDDGTLTVINCTFHSNKGAVLNFYSSDPLIKGCRFYENGGMAALFDDYSGGTFENNMIYRQAHGLFVKFYANPVIFSNTIYELSDVGMTFNGMMAPKAINNTIRDCSIGILLWYSNARLEGNEIHNCQNGIDLVADSRPEITSCITRDNGMSGIVMNGSYALVQDSEVLGNMYDGIRMFNGSSMEAISSSINDNKDDGLQASDSYVKFTNCTMFGNLGDTVFSRDDSIVELFDSVIQGSPELSSDKEMKMETGSEIRAYDTYFDPLSVHFEDGASRLTVVLRSTYSVKDPDLRPLSGIDVVIENGTGYRRTLTTNSEGLVWRNLEKYHQFDLNGDGDGEDPGEMIAQDYNISIVEEGFLPYTGDVVMEIDHLHDIILELEPEVKVIFNSPGNDDMEVAVDTSVLIRFDRDVDPDTINIQVDGPGGLPASFDMEYMARNRTVRLTFVNDLRYSSMYEVILTDVSGAMGEVFHGPFGFRFRTEDEPLPDNDMDGLPDDQDDDDDNDGHSDSVEVFYGTDPFNPLDFPVIVADDDDDDDDDDEEPEVPTDDDEEPLPVNVTPVEDLDDDIQPSPYIDDSDLEPVERTDNSTSGGDDGGGSMLILVVSSILGVLILAGTVLMIFLSGRKQNTLKDGEI